MKIKFLVFVLVVICLSMSFSVFARQSGPSVNPEDFANVQTAVNNHGITLATLQNQFNELLANFQALSGDVGRTAKGNSDQQRLSLDVQARMQLVEDKITALQSQMNELKSEGLLSPTASKRLDEYKKFARGLEFVNAGQFQQAIKSLESFMSDNKKSIYNSFAQFWIGESYYFQGDFAMAIKQLQKMIEANPASAKVPTAVYHQGVAFVQLKAYDDAKAFFDKVIRTYPQSLEAAQSQTQINRINEIRGTT